MRNRLLKDLCNRAEHSIEAVVNLTADICEVPSPTGAEGQRARYIASQFRERGYAPELDEIGNVYVRRGNRGGPVLLLAAHSDTVFPESTPISVERRKDKLYGPGIGDNSLGVAAMITTLELLDELKIETDIDIVAVADVGEEGLGNLRGIRAAVDSLSNNLQAVIAVEGHNLGRVTNAGVGSKRWRIDVRGPGGHSWGAFGRPNAIHVLAKIIARISDVTLAGSPRTTYNVGVVSGGTSVNTIAADASAIIDMRSVDAGALDALAEQVKKISEGEVVKDIHLQFNVIGERPAGSIPAAHELVRRATEILRWAGIDPMLDASSTDVNYPLHLGIPSICVGITRGGRGHTVDEFIKIPPIGSGLSQLARLAVEVPAMIAEEKLVRE